MFLNWPTSWLLASQIDKLFQAVDGLRVRSFRFLYLYNNTKMSQFLMFLLLFVPGLTFAQEKASTITIKSAVGAALEKYPVTRSAREKVEEADASRRSAISKAFPTMEIKATATESKSAANGQFVTFGGNPYSQYKLDLNLSQPIYAGGALTAGINYSNREKDIRQTELRIAERDLTLNVMESFYSVLLQQRQAELLKQVQVVLKQALGITERYVKIGRGQKADLLQIRSQLALISPRISQAENKVIDAVSQLAVYLGLPEQTKLTISGNLAPVSKDIYKKQKTVPPLPLLEIQRADWLVEQAENKRTVDLAKHWPSLAAVGTIGRSSYTKPELFDEFATSWSVGLQLTVPIFTGLSSFHERRLTAAQVKQLELSAEQLHSQSRSTQVQSEKDLEVAQQMLEGSQAAAKFSAAALKEAEREYRLQISDYLHLITAEENYIDSATAYNQAKYDYIIAVAKYFNATGVPLAELVDMLEKNKNKEE